MFREFFSEIGILPFAFLHMLIDVFSWLRGWTEWIILYKAVTRLIVASGDRKKAESQRTHIGGRIYWKIERLKYWKIERWLIGREQISVPDIRAVLHKIKTILLWGETKSRRARTLRDEKGWRSSFILLSILRYMILSGVAKHPNHSCKYPK